MSKLKRSEKLAFISVSSDSGTVFHRLKNFTEFSVSKNPVSYSRQYIDEDFERSDIVSYAPSISYSFDFDNENPAHVHLASITDNELVGDEALCNMVIVDISQNTDGSCAASGRIWTLIPDREGNDTEAYTYSGTFRANGKRIAGIATSDDNWETCSFSAL